VPVFRAFGRCGGTRVLSAREKRCEELHSPSMPLAHGYALQNLHLYAAQEWIRGVPFTVFLPKDRPNTPLFGASRSVR